MVPCLVVAAVTTACGRARATTDTRPQAAADLPRLPALPEALPVLPQAPTLPVDSTPIARRITLTAADADVRSLLIAIAREGGINLVVSADVRRRVSVSFRDATPEEALRAVVAEAGLTIVEPRSAEPFPAVVYYQLPVNVNEAPAEAIAARFGVSAELARWIAESRPQPERPRQQP